MYSASRLSHLFNVHVLSHKSVIDGG
jgi:hypothetical protein